MALDIVLFPHCDLHVALHGAPELRIRVASRDPAPDKMSFVLTDVTASCAFDFFAPYEPVGNRLKAFVAIDPATGRVTPNAIGINLVRVRFPGHEIVARIQVHDSILGWWFGNPSIVTARHDTIAHSQPSIYALFSTDPSGTDLVGDITGHGYVPLTSSDTGVFTVNADGRLRGVSEATKVLTGSFLGVTRTLPVKVVDYAKTRRALQCVRSADRKNPGTKHNILFLPEGFRNTKADRDRFDEAVTKVVGQIFSKPRHAPYNILGKSFNVWKAFEPSEQHAATCAFRVNDEAAPGVLAAGFPIPCSQPVSSRKTAYALDELVPIVGLPLRTESRNMAQLTTLWGSQSLRNLDAARVDEKVVAAWRVQRSVGILEARDTFFGLSFGTRYADRSSTFATAMPPPALDSSTDAALAPFVARMYEWFSTDPVRLLVPDPRRHPPELFRSSAQSLGNSILTYIRGLQDAEGPHAPVGVEWIPDSSPTPAFKRSRGLVAIIANDGLNGGANFNDNTITSTTLNQGTVLGFASDDSGNQRVRRRTPPDPIAMDLQECIDTIAHEFGHSFNLGDEYEEFAGDNAFAFSGHDNVTTLSVIHPDPLFMADRKISPSKVKWFDLLRIRWSDRLTQPSAAVGGQMRVTIDRGQIGKWKKAKEKELEVSLRHIDLPAAGRQLPQPADEAHHLVGLVIDSIDESAGTILLGGPQMPATPPAFPAGSLLYNPRRDPTLQLMFLVERKVLEKLTSTSAPLNENSDRAVVNDEADHPVDIAGFKPPCKSYKLIGVYEGAIYVTGMTYRPAGLCKMRKKGDAGPGDGEFCHVCKYLIVNRVDPALHGLLDKKYYPTAKMHG